MFNVMIVEDEPPILRSITKAVTGADSDFLVSATARNGREAVEKLEKEDFDIVFTDIKMPLMTGLELAEWIRAHKPATMVIILSGYSDFQYVQTALKHKVFDYLLKPVSGAKIGELAARIREELGEKAAAEHDKDTNCVVMLVSAGAYLLYGSEVMLPGEDFFAGERLEKALAGYLAAGETVLPFNAVLPSERYVVIQSDSAARQRSIVEALFAALENAELPVTIVYRTHVRFGDAGAALTSLRDRLIRSSVFARSSLIDASVKPDGFENTGEPYTKQDIDAAVAAIRTGDRNALRAGLASTLAAMIDAASTQEEVNGFLNIVLDSYALAHPDEMQRKNVSVKHEFVNALASYTGFDSFVDDVTSILSTLRRDVRDPDRYARLADSVENYLVAHYDRTLTNKVLAKEFGFVPSYISRIFKRAKGVSPNEFLTRYRVDLAKGILSAEPDVKIKDVAERVGFKEPYYFSKTFKKETGFWPSEYTAAVNEQK